MGLEQFIDVEYFRELLRYYSKLGYNKSYVSALNDFDVDYEYAILRSKALYNESEVAKKVKDNLLNLPLPLPIATGLTDEEAFWANGFQHDLDRQNAENGTNISMYDYCVAIIAKWELFYARKHMFDSAVTEWVKYAHTLFNNEQYERLQQMFDLMESLPSGIDEATLATLRTTVNNI